MTVNQREHVIPPTVIDAEQALLGACLHNSEAVDKVREFVAAEDFSEDVHRAIFSAMCARRDRGEMVDLTLIRTAIGEADLGGLTVGEYVARLAAEAITVIAAPDYAKTIRNASSMRQVLATAQDAVSAMAVDAIADPASYACGMIEALDAVAVANQAANLRRVSLAQSATSVIRRVLDAKDGRIQRGAPYGLPRLDRATMGLRANQLVILAGRPGMGKTTAALHIALSAALAGYAVPFFSLEMDAEELAERALASLSYDTTDHEALSYRAICEAVHLTDRAVRRLAEAQRRADALALWIEQQPGLTVSQIVARSRQMRTRAERAGLPFGPVIVDHIGLIRPSKRYSGNRVQEITEISSSLKAAAKELGAPVMALSQLNREVEKRPDKRPMLADLRDSGSIEQDADVVLGLYREAYYLEHKAERSFEEDERLAEVGKRLEIEILKQRSGPTARFECFCDIGCNVIAELV